MNIEPEYMFDNLGNVVGVFLPIAEWNRLSEEMRLELPKWQKQLIYVRLDEFRQNPENTFDWDVVLKELNKEDETLKG